MKVIVNRSELAAALALANFTIAARSPKPILRCVILVAEDNKLSVYATDLETSIHQSIDQVQIERAGRSLAPADKLLEIIKNTIDDTVTLEADAESLRVVSSDANFKMFKMDDKDYPPEPPMDGSRRLSVKLVDLQEVLGRTMFASAKTETKYAAMSGIKLIAKGKTLEIVATDGRRLAHSSCDLMESLGKTELSAVLGQKGLQLVSKLSPARGEDPSIATVVIRENRAVFECDGIRIGSVLVEGEFPPYEDVIPKNASKKITFDREAFAGSVRRAALFTTEDRDGVRFSFNRKGAHMASIDPAAGETSVNFPGKYEGADLTIGFNATYLLDGLKAAKDDEVTFEMTEPSRPGLLIAERFRYVCTPVNME